MAAHNELGSRGEDLAAKYMEEHGFIVLDRNWHHGHRELDLVVRDSRQLVIVEVKTRSSEAFGRPEEAVGSRKIRSIVSSADSYMKLHQIDLPVRFDIITVIADSRLGDRIEHIEDAFFPPLWN